MASVNKVILVGHLGRDPEVRYLPEGGAVANVSMATTDSWKDKSGEKQERTEWHRVVFYGRQAEVAGEYLKKGSQIYVEGKLRTRKWTDKEGAERYTTEIAAQNLTMLGSPRDDARGSDPGAYAQASGRSSANSPGKAQGNQAQGSVSGGAKKGGSAFDEMDDDIPF